MYVDGAEKTVVLQGLDPLTEYQVEVFSVVGDESSEPLLGADTTRGFSHGGILTSLGFISILSVTAAFLCP